MAKVIAPIKFADPVAFTIIFDVKDSGTTRQVYLELDNCQLKTLDKVASVGNLIFIDLAGTALVKTAYTIDGITNILW